MKNFKNEVPTGMTPVGNLIYQIRTVLATILENVKNVYSGQCLIVVQPAGNSNQCRELHK
jgi:hypothetical protein